MRGMQRNCAEQEAVHRNCMLSILVFLLFPGKESSEGKGPSATQQETNALDSTLNMFLCANIKKKSQNSDNISFRAIYLCQPLFNK